MKLIFLAAAALLFPAVTAMAQPGPAAPSLSSGRQNCWEAPPPATIVEAFKTQRARPSPAPGSSVLAMSAGGLDAAFSAGFLVGLGETDQRPRFSAVTGVGVSALIAPFAFIGQAGERHIADLFNCSPASFKELAESAAMRLDGATLSAIAREHESGRRLVIATMQSRSRPSVIWDIGRIAASGRPKALEEVRRILLAAVDRLGLVEPKEIPGAGVVAQGAAYFDNPGAGEDFLIPWRMARLQDGQARYYLIHNGKLYPAESGQYISARRRIAAADDLAAGLAPAYNVLSRAQRHGQSVSIATIDCHGEIPRDAQKEVDGDYLKALFLEGYRRGHTGDGWEDEFPGWTYANALDKQSKHQASPAP